MNLLHKKAPTIIALFAFFLVLSLLIPPASNTSADNVPGTVVVGDTPKKIFPLGTSLYVTNYGFGDDTVTAIDTSNNNATSTVTVGNTPIVATSLGSKVYVANNAGTLNNTYYKLLQFMKFTSASFSPPVHLKSSSWSLSNA